MQELCNPLEQGFYYWDILFASFNEESTWEYVLLSLKGVGFTSIHFQVTVDRLLEMFLAPAM